MSRDQLQDEKLAIQKVLLQHENTFGRPVSDTVSTIYSIESNDGTVDMTYHGTMSNIGIYLLEPFVDV